MKVFQKETARDWNEDPWDDVVDLPLLDEREFVRLPRSGNRLRWVMWLLGLGLVGGAISAGLFALDIARQIDPPGEPGAAQQVIVNEGMTVSDIAARLELQGIIDDDRVFRWYVGFKDGLTVIPGTYEVRVDESFGDIVDILGTPPELTFTKVTFPEGMTLEQMGQRLAEALPRLSAERFVELGRSGLVVSSLAPAGTTDAEGLLFPDTYQIAANEDEAAVLVRMADLMERIAGKERVDGKPTVEARYDVIKIASLIECEAKTDVDRPKIARVIYNRLFRQMPLGIDATLLYGTPGSQTGITDEMKQADNPYNTYRFIGLPPTPIAMPSRASIEAAMNPSEGTWLYYVVADEEGNHVFADTYEEHLVNVDKARAAGLL